MFSDVPDFSIRHCLHDISNVLITKNMNVCKIVKVMSQNKI